LDARPWAAGIPIRLIGAIQPAPPLMAEGIWALADEVKSADLQ
jgi:hypothetical protein